MCRGATFVGCIKRKEGKKISFFILGRGPPSPAPPLLSTRVWSPYGLECEATPHAIEHRMFRLAQPCCRLGPCIFIFLGISFYFFILYF